MFRSLVKFDERVEQRKMRRLYKVSGTYTRFRSSFLHGPPFPVPKADRVRRTFIEIRVSSTDARGRVISKRVW